MSILPKKIKVSDVAAEKTNNYHLRWGLNPFLNLGKCIAFLQFPSQAHEKESLISLILRFSAWFITIAINATLIFTNFYWDGIWSNLWHMMPKEEGGSFASMVLTWSIFVTSFTGKMYSIGIHTIIMFDLSAKWKRLVESLELTDTTRLFGLKNCCKPNYQNLRILSWIGFVYVILLV